MQALKSGEQFAGIGRVETGPVVRHHQHALTQRSARHQRHLDPALFFFGAELPGVVHQAVHRRNQQVFVAEHRQRLRDLQHQLTLRLALAPVLDQPMAQRCQVHRLGVEHHARQIGQRTQVVNEFGQLAGADADTREVMTTLFVERHRITLCQHGGEAADHMQRRLEKIGHRVCEGVELFTAALQVGAALHDALRQRVVKLLQPDVGKMPGPHVHHADQHDGSRKPLHAAASQLHQHQLAIDLALCADPHLLLEVSGRQAGQPALRLAFRKKSLDLRHRCGVGRQAVKSSRCLVERQHMPGIGIQQPHGLGVAVKKTAVAQLAALQQQQSLASVADIAEVDHRATGMRPEAVLDPLVFERIVNNKNMRKTALQGLLGNASVVLGNQIRDGFPELHAGQAGAGRMHQRLRLAVERHDFPVSVEHDDALGGQFQAGLNPLAIGRFAAGGKGAAPGRSRPERLQPRTEHGQWRLHGSRCALAPQRHLRFATSSAVT